MGRMKPTKRSGVFSEVRLKIRDLPYFEEVKDFLAKGWTLTDVAKEIQRRGDLTDYALVTIETHLKHIREGLPPVAVAAHVLPRLHQEAIEKVRNGLNVLESLEMLFHLQMDRIAIDVQLEKNINKLFPTTSREVREAREILQAYAQTQMDFGLVTRQLGRVELDAGAPVFVGLTPQIEKAANDPGSRHKVLAVFNQVLALADRVGRDEGDGGGSSAV